MANPLFLPGAKHVSAFVITAGSGVIFFLNRRPHVDLDIIAPGCCRIRARHGKAVSVCPRHKHWLLFMLPCMLLWIFNLLTRAYWGEESGEERKAKERAEEAVWRRSSYDISSQLWALPGAPSVLCAIEFMGKCWLLPVVVKRSWMWYTSRNNHYFEQPLYVIYIMQGSSFLKFTWSSFTTWPDSWDLVRHSITSVLYMGWAWQRGLFGVWGQQAWYETVVHLSSKMRGNDKGLRVDWPDCGLHVVFHPCALVYRAGRKWHIQTCLAVRFFQDHFDHDCRQGSQQGKERNQLWNFVFRKCQKRRIGVCTSLALLYVGPPISCSYIIMWKGLDTCHTTAILCNWTFGLDSSWRFMSGTSAGHIRFACWRQRDFSFCQECMLRW